ncbi:Bifunctional DNA primase/polymerase [Gemmatirosa kalamazoonensis]|uniref:Bifunctional DNA primase/polymerase n=1 Tax=Gemmatirosa kalamazoonensis TaxID=861299 RepID=W0RM79_9BACT|nr:bifunctional DNA primase/polymerase [Gemmatirosa kalamazoonensis]AHG91861.1 Bifunctional DNA primase/polymerase [Gemmatirosa kalamazoonensis]
MSAPERVPSEVAGAPFPGATPLACAAVAYARRGWAVLPCAPGAKLPLLPNGFHGASTDPSTVAAWWRAEPRANIGVVPGLSRLLVAGAPYALVALDLDGPRGFATADALGVPTDTLTATTGRPDGGCHRYFVVPTSTVDGAPLIISNRALGSGLDVRHARGYVIVPPSVHPSGAEYRWTVTAPAAPLPPVLLARLLAPTRDGTTTRGNAARNDTRYAGRARTHMCPRRTPAGADARRRALAYLARVPHALGDGDGRNMTAFRIAVVLLHDMQLGPHEVAAFLAEWNATNRPPLSFDELARVAANAALYGGPRGAA